MKKYMSVIFFIFFITSISAHFSPEKEIKTIQTLPRKPHATLDIEVTKVKSQEIMGQIDEKSKVITVDFSEILNNQKNKMNIDRSQYEVYPIEDLGVLQFTKNISLFNKIIQNKFQVTKINASISINYENKPEKLYLGIFNKSTNNIDKIYKVNYFSSKLEATMTKNFYLENPIYIRSGNQVNQENISKIDGIYRFGLTKSHPNSTAENTFNYKIKIDNGFSDDNLHGLPTYGDKGGNENIPQFALLNLGNSDPGIAVFSYHRLGSSPILNNSKYALYKSTNSFSNGNAYLNTSLYKYDDGNTIVRFVVFGDYGYNSYRSGFEIIKWDLNAKTITFRLGWNTSIPNYYYMNWIINIPQFDIKSYYENIFPQITIGSNITKNITLKEASDGVLLGTVKLKDKNTLSNLATDSHGGMRFVGNNNVTLSNANKTINGTIYMTPVETDTTGVNSNTYFSNTDRSTALNVYFKLNNATNLETDLEYSSNTNRLLKLEVVNKNNFNIEIINNLRIKILKEEKSANLLFKNPLPKAYGSNKGVFSLSSIDTSEIKNPIGIASNPGTLSITSNIIKSSLGYSQYNFKHKIAIWFDWGTPTATTIREFFQVDSDGKIKGTHEKEQSVAGDMPGAYERDWIKYSINNGILSIGMKEWRTYQKGSNPANPSGEYTMKIAHFKDDITIDDWISEDLALAVDSYNISFETLKPEIYYNESNSIKLGGTQQIQLPRNIRQISLGKVSVKPNTQIDRELLKGSSLYPIPDFSFYSTNEKIIFKADDGSIIEGQVEINGDSKTDESGRDVTLHILTDKIDSKKIYIADNALLGKLGTPANKVSDEVFYSIINRLELILEDSFIVDYNVDDLDFGAAIANNKAYNEAKTTLNLTLADDIVNPTLSYAIKTSPTTTNNYYTNFKLHPNGVEISDDFVTTDIWLGNEVKDNNNLQKRSIDINGKINDISNAQIGTSTKLYQNIVEIEIKLQ